MWWNGSSGLPAVDVAPVSQTPEGMVPLRMPRFTWLLVIVVVRRVVLLPVLRRQLVLSVSRWVGGKVKRMWFPLGGCFVVFPVGLVSNASIRLVSGVQ